MAAGDDVVATLKFLVIGDSGAGKSSLLMRFIDDVFDEDQGPTIGVDFKSKVIDLRGNKIKLTVWDTAGQERFRTLTASYYRGAHGVILVYDVTRPETFDHVKMWMNEVDVYATNPNIIKMVVGNKIDLQQDRVVTTSQGTDFAAENSTLFIECSAKSKQGVKDAFEELTQKVLDTPDLWQKAGQGRSSGVTLGGSGAAAPTGDSCGACVI
eukprot:m.37787 g.37787  ORF g.37787 m.37787 type:complete len:211 (-) comp11134_c0_seq2:124-756(-)